MSTPLQSVAILDRLQHYLSRALESDALSLTNSNEDGRLNSQENEKQLSDALRYFALSNDWFQQADLSIEVSPARFWYDFAVHGPDLFLPVNIKVSTFRSQDNLSSKEGLFFALTGRNPKTLNINSWENFCRELATHLDCSTEHDYYFLAVNKASVGDVFWTSLKSLADLRPNGSNPPYQCRWSNNRERIDRSSDEAARFLLNALRESFALGARPLISFNTHLQEIIEP